jgi:hypothetical protein
MKKLNKIYLMVLLATIIISTLLSSCKSSKSGCDAYGNSRVIDNDSMIVKVEHCHIEKENYCFYSVDTIFSKK